MAIKGRFITLDKLGASASTLCAVHCLIVGAFFSVLPFVGLGFLGSPAIDFAMITVAVVVGFFALKVGYQKHRSIVPATLYVAGLGSILIGHFAFGHSHQPVQSVSYSTLLLVLGSGFLVANHIANLRLTSKLESEQDTQ